MVQWDLKEMRGLTEAMVYLAFLGSMGPKGRLVLRVNLATRDFKDRRERLALLGSKGILDLRALLGFLDLLVQWAHKDFRDPSVKKVELVEMAPQGLLDLVVLWALLGHKGRRVPRGRRDHKDLVVVNLSVDLTLPGFERTSVLSLFMASL
uniref:Uncharacterized protein n=1 Tax=Cacopsylla melanoneura TaxID=428564 RepID=A0A8D8M444_9HEMI